MNTKLLEYRIFKLERLIKEAKQVGTLYHNCSAEIAAKYICKDDKLQSSGAYINKITGTTDIISFTRFKHKRLPHNITSLIDTPFIVRFKVNGDKLSENYKVFPYNDFPDATGKLAMLSDQQEECVKGPIKNFSKYVESVEFIFSSNINIDYANDSYASYKGRLNTFNQIVDWCNKNNIEYVVDKKYADFINKAKKGKGDPLEVSPHVNERNALKTLINNMGLKRMGLPNTYKINGDIFGYDNDKIYFVMEYINSTKDPIGYVLFDAYITNYNTPIQCEDTPNVSEVCSKAKINADKFSEMDYKAFIKFIKKLPTACGISRKVKNVMSKLGYI